LIVTPNYIILSGIRIYYSSGQHLIAKKCRVENKLNCIYLLIEQHTLESLE
jgi:hypothetical protein